MVVVAYFADDDWSIPAFHRLLRAPDVEVRVVVERQQPSSPTLARAACDAGIPVLSTPKVNGVDFAARYQPFGIELGVSNAYDQIFAPAFITAHPHGIINCHTSLLPRYRGRNALTWAMIAGEPTVGVTVHHLDQGIDTGDILIQVAVPVGPGDDFGLVRQRVGNAGAVAIAEAIHQIITRTTDPIPQPSLGPGFTVPRRRPGDEIIDWHHNAQQVHDFVRALAPPGPGARAIGPDRAQWTIKRTKRLPETGPFVGRPGTVLAHDMPGFVVKCSDSAINVLFYEPDPDRPQARAHSRPPVGYRFALPTDPILDEHRT